MSDGAFSRRRYDAVIVGGGPSGCSAALNLAARQANIILIEKAAPPRYKTCGGGVVRRALDLLPSGHPPVIQRTCRQAELNLLDSGLHFVSGGEEPLISMVMRTEFDAALMNAAAAAGAEIATDCPVQDVRQENGGVVVVTGRGDIRADYLIAADGATGRLSKLAGWSETRRLVPAVEYEVTCSRSCFEKFSGTARFDFGIVPHGYAWVFPKGEHCSVGLLTIRPGRMNLHERVEEYMKVIGLNDIQAVSRHGYMIPMKPRTDGFVRGRILLAGDAAGFADPLTGEGITFALLSGRHAAAAVAGALNGEGPAGERYMNLLREQILPELRYGSVLADILYQYAPVRNWIFRHYGQELCDAFAGIITGRSTYRRLLGSPSNYLKLVGRYFRHLVSSHPIHHSQEVL